MLEGGLTRSVSRLAIVVNSRGHGGCSQSPLQVVRGSRVVPSARFHGKSGSLWQVSRAQGGAPSSWAEPANHKTAVDSLRGSLATINYLCCECCAATNPGTTRRTPHTLHARRGPVRAVAYRYTWCRSGTKPSQSYREPQSIRPE